MQFPLSAHIFKLLNILYILEKQILINSFHFYFLAKDLSLNNIYWISIFFRDAKNIPQEGTVSQMFC